MTPKRIPKKLKIILVSCFLLEIALQGPLNSKGIRMNAADRPSLKITGNDSKNDSKEIKKHLGFLFPVGDSSTRAT
jgi:hypothetical protein